MRKDSSNRIQCKSRRPYIQVADLDLCIRKFWGAVIYSLYRSPILRLARLDCKIRRRGGFWRVRKLRLPPAHGEFGENQASLRLRSSRLAFSPWYFVGTHRMRSICVDCSVRKNRMQGYRFRTVGMLQTVKQVRIIRGLQFSELSERASPFPTKHQRASE